MPPPPQMPDGNSVPAAWGAAASKPGGAQAAEPAKLAAGAPEPEVPAPTAGGAPDEVEPVEPVAAATHSDAQVRPHPVPVEGDWLSSICGYLQSADGAYRSNQPDEGHRCTAQDPPGTLPLAFQESFCLTDRHPRCEMYKYAQEASGAAVVPPQQVAAATVQSSGRSMALPFGSSGDGSSRRPTIIAAGIGGIVIFIILLAFGLGSCSGETAVPGADASASPAGQETGEATSEPTPEPTPTPEPDPGSTSEATVAPVAPQLAILYEVQEGEALMAIGEKFGVSRRRIIKANEGMEDKKPYVEAGDVIVVPVSSEMTIEQIEAVPGYQGMAP